MTAQLITQTREKMEKAVEALKSELKKIRTGKAHVSMLDSIKVNYYGTPTPLAQAAAMACPDPKSFVITPWEPPMLKEIEQAIVKSDLGMTPINDGKVIRLKLPTLTEERRRDLAKSTKKVVEESRVAIRMARRDANEDVKKSLKAKEIGEDEGKRVNEQVQKLTDEFVKIVDKIAEDKETDIMTI